MADESARKKRVNFTPKQKERIYLRDKGEMRRLWQAIPWCHVVKVPDRQKNFLPAF